MDSFESSLGEERWRMLQAEHSPVTRPTQESSQLLEILPVRLIESILFSAIDVDLGDTKLAR